MITTRFPQGAKYLQLLRRTGCEGVCVARIHRQPSGMCLTFGGGLGRGRVRFEGCRMALTGNQRMAAEAGAENDGVEWKVVDGTSLVWVMMLMMEGKDTEEGASAEKILEAPWGWISSRRTASSRTNNAIQPSTRPTPWSKRG